MSNLNVSSVLGDSPAQVTLYGHLDSSDIVEIVLKSLIYITGVFGNIMVIFVILILREYKKVTHWYVLQLAFADFIFLQTLPFKIDEQLKNGWLYSIGTCKARETVLFFNYYASIMFLTMMAIDRYLAVCHGLSSRVQRWRSPVYSYVITALIWLAVLLLCIPVMLYSAKVGFEPHCRCTMHFPPDPTQYCHEQMMTSPSELEICRDVIYPRVHGQSCHEQTSTKDKSSDEDDSNDYGSGLKAIFSEYEGLDTSSIEIGTAATPKVPEFVTKSEGHYAPQCIYPRRIVGWKIFIYFNFVAMFLVPLLVISSCYILIVLRLSKTMVGTRKSSNADNYHSSTDGGANRKIVKKTKRSKSSTSTTSRSYAEKRRVTVMCAVLVLLFAACWLPFHSVHVAKLHGIHIPTIDGYLFPDKNLCTTIIKIATVLAYLNSALNPYLYNFLGTFRKRVRQIRQQRVIQSFLSATGLSRITGRSSVSAGAGNSSESSKNKRSSVANDRRSSAPLESVPLQPTGEEGFKSTNI